MYQLLVVSAVLQLAVTLGQDCCTLDQWEGYVGEVAGSAVSGDANLLTGDISISYDYTNSRAASSSYLVVDGQKQETKVIMNYETKMMYTIIGTHCTATQLTGDMTNYCVSDSYGENTTPVETATLVEGCIPIQEDEDISTGQIGAVQTFVYYNMSPGIKDPNVFLPPSSCTGIKHLKAVPKLSHKVINYFLNKITKQ